MCMFCFLDRAFTVELYGVKPRTKTTTNITLQNSFIIEHGKGPSFGRSEDFTKNLA